MYVTDLNVGRNPEEVLRVLDALQTDELCPCNWKKGEDTLKAALEREPRPRSLSDGIGLGHAIRLHVT